MTSPQTWRITPVLTPLMKENPTRDLGAKIDEEVARTGLSDDVIGPKVHISYHAS